MKKLLLILLFIPLVSFGQMDYYVSAKGGLNVREAPNSKAKKVATILYGQKVTIESKTGIKLTINDTDKKTGITKVIEGEWVEVTSVTNIKGYVFDGFLSRNKKTDSFLTRNNGTIWTNGFSTYTFSEDMPDYIDISSCDPCNTPSTECHMCGYSWMKVDIDSFSFGSNYQNDFFYDQVSTRFYEKNKIIWSVNFKSGNIVEYNTDKLKWIPADSDFFEIEKIRLKNKPILDFIKLKQKEDDESIDEEFL